MATNFMLAFPWINVIPFLLATLSLTADLSVERYFFVWPYVFSFNILMFSGVAVLWTVGGSASFWKYSL